MTRLDKIDTKDSIERALGNRLSFQELVQERLKYAASARRDGNPELESWIVLRAWFLSKDGNSGKIVRDDIRSNGAVQFLPDVVSLNTVMAAMPKFSVAFSLTRAMPDADQVCSFCGVGWTTVEEMTEAEMGSTGRERADWHHRGCQILAGKIGTKKFFEKALSEAGFGPEDYFLEAVRNQYWSESNIAMYESNPWFRVHTRKGAFLVGWRKSVVNIQWDALPNKEAVASSMEEFLKNESTTKDRYMVHAGGSLTVSRYIRGLREAMEST